MADQRTMAELLRAPTEGYAEAIVIPSILAEQFELKHSLINMMTTEQFFRLEKDNPHDHICWFNKITSTIKYKDVPSSAIKLMLFPFSLAGAASRTTNLRNEISKFQQRVDESFHEAWDRYKDLLRACPHHGFTELHQLDTFYNSLNPADQDSLNVAAGGNLDSQTYSRSQSANECCDYRHDGYAQTISSNPPLTPVKAVEETYVTYGGSRTLPSNTVANPKGELKAITTRSGLVIDGHTVPTPSRSINPEVDERVEETFTDPDLAEYTIKVPPPLVQKYKPSSQQEYVVHQRDPRHLNVPYPSRMLKQKLQEKDEKMLKALLANKEKLQELTNTPLNEICSAVILKKLPEKLGDPGKFLIPCGFSELKCKALADLGASINLMPLCVWKKLGLPELIPTRMILELAIRAICTPAGIARYVFVLVGKFTFPANFVIVYYESDHRVPFILGRRFLRTARALIDVHGEEMILRDGDERLTLNMRHDTSSYSNQPQKESINFIIVFNNSSEDFLEAPFPNQPSGNPTFLPHHELTSSEVNNDIFDSEGCNFDIESDLKEIEFLLYQDKDYSLKDLIDQKDLANLVDIFVDFIPEMFTDEHALDYSPPLIFDEYDDDFSKVESDAGNVYDDPFDSK
nr:hypothetical protein [Tanacetum cinerariifolium]